MKQDSRVQAFCILKKVVNDKIPLSHLESQPLTPLTKELCYGFCRHYFRLEAIANQLLDKPVKDGDVWLIVLMGLYQLLCMHKPDYAVVNESVSLLSRCKKNWAKGFINAVLRRFCREKNTILEDLQSNEGFVFEHAPWFLARLRSDWPSFWHDIAIANNSHPPMSLRVNQRVTDRAAYLNRLEALGMHASPHRYSDVGLTLESPCDVTSLPGFEEGMVSVHDESAQLAVSLLDLKPNLRVLDACCAPGGKTCHILEVEPDLAACMALDIDERRLQRVHDNLSRLRLQATLIKGDGLTPEVWWDGNAFDRILLDAPCSATGVIRRHPDIKLLRNEEGITTVARLQANLLHALWPLLAEDGLLVYATCSIMKEENENQIAQFLATHKEGYCVDMGVSWGVNTGYGHQLFPQDQGGDGFFYAVLKKRRCF